MSNDRPPPGNYASPPCFMHELQPGADGTHCVDGRQRADVMRWRKAERKRLIAQRLACPAHQRTVLAQSIAAGVEAVIGAAGGLTVSAYWPFRGEPDLRAMMARVCEAGGISALPVVVARGHPLIFRRWRPGDRLERGIWNIPCPAPESEEVVPDVVIAPVVGFDRACYRLGYGGGFFDRTLAAMPVRPRVLGVGYEEAAIPTIYPQPHDIPMDVVVTEHGAHTPKPDGA